MFETVRFLYRSEPAVEPLRVSDRRGQTTGCGSGIRKRLLEGCEPRTLSGMELEAESVPKLHHHSLARSYESRPK